MVLQAERETLKVEEVAKRLGISRDSAYAAARTGAIAGVPVLKIGRRMLVSRKALERVLERIEAANEAA